MNQKSDNQTNKLNNRIQTKPKTRCPNWTSDIKIYAENLHSVNEEKKRREPLDLELRRDLTVPLSVDLSHQNRTPNFFQTRRSLREPRHQICASRRTRVRSLEPTRTRSRRSLASRCRRLVLVRSSTLWSLFLLPISGARGDLLVIARLLLGAIRDRWMVMWF